MYQKVSKTLQAVSKF